uniref:Uncharacterized protein n=1 Tax=Catharus ustulatus TaxID=91951 RepID=A0A8C3XZI0_CATUS
MNIPWIRNLAQGQCSGQGEFTFFATGLILKALPTWVPCGGDETTLWQRAPWSSWVFSGEVEGCGRSRGLILHLHLPLYVYVHTHVHTCLYLHMDTHTHTRDTLCIDLPPATIYKGWINQKNKFANSAFPRSIRKTNFPISGSQHPRLSLASASPGRSAMSLPRRSLQYVSGFLTKGREINLIKGI